ncbi:hypothetical protein Sme01_43640 [Sphaerisporangium melleum]|uniref:NACHT domain-containing protein n=1 Tax=Sphaerisporangium melleum TaxID=321316 RepID=A0A917QYI4_9ACTN|nr:NACHT domain-containing protein [Sphaerisporangium melleum]GGK77681.1 hypothetical protein GCM10007964_20600 [Sphaerisporangium melleum]GII71888.1 hypothetical protein Sme01_43640 [Sphaerisporangium melleum]
MRGLKVLLRVLAGATGLVAAGVATNQVLDDGELSWNWAYAALAVALLADLSRELLTEQPPAPPGPVHRPPHGGLGLYLRQLRASVGYMETLGIATQSEYVLRMRQVYVDVSLVPRPSHATAREPYVGAVRAAAVPGERRTLESFLGGDDRGRVLAVIGGPGSGKTTLVRNTTLDLCGRRWLRRRPLPVLLYLRDHAAALLVGEPPGLAAVAVSASWLDGRVSAAWLERRLDRGGCVVLLDGLDEVADEGDRARVVAWIGRQIARHPGNQYVLTSRPHGYLSNPLPNAEVLQVRRFTHEQISRYLHGWYYAIECRAADATGPGIRKIAEEKADDLLARLRATPGLYDLAANPLLLTMIANVHRYRGRLPGSRAALYAEMCDVLLHRRQEARNLADATGLLGPQKERVVRHLALAMMRAKVRDLPAAEAAKAIRRALRQVPGRVAPEVFLEEARKSGLLVEREQGVYAFAHLTLQEYLAAAQIGQQDAGPLPGHVDDPWWRETTLLWAANADATPVIEACMASGTVRALALAFDCAEQALQVDPDVRERLEALLASGDAEEDPGRRRLLAGVMAERTLREVIWLDENTAVCARPVSRDLYDMFLRDTGIDGHTWYAGQDEAPSAAGDEAAVGILAGHAERFVTWLNALSDGETAYRLPTQEEIADPAVHLVAGLTGRTVWVSDFDLSVVLAPGSGGINIVLHQPAGVPSPYAPRIEHLLQHPAYDAALCGDYIRLVLGAELSAEILAQAPVFSEALRRAAETWPDHDRGDFLLVLTLALYLNLDRLQPRVTRTDRASRARRAMALAEVMRLGRALGLNLAADRGIAAYLAQERAARSGPAQVTSLKPAVRLGDVEDFTGSQHLLDLPRRIGRHLQMSGHLESSRVDAVLEREGALAPCLAHAVNRAAADRRGADRLLPMSSGIGLEFGPAGVLARLSGSAEPLAHLRPVLSQLLASYEDEEVPSGGTELRRALGLALVLDDDRSEGTMIALRTLLTLWRKPVSRDRDEDALADFDRVLTEFTGGLSFTLRHRGNPLVALRRAIRMLHPAPKVPWPSDVRQKPVGHYRPAASRTDDLAVAHRLALEADDLIAPVLSAGAPYDMLDFAHARLRLLAAAALLSPKAGRAGGRDEEMAPLSVVGVAEAVAGAEAAELLAEALAGLAGLQERFEGRLPANEVIVLVRA